MFCMCLNSSFNLISVSALVKRNDVSLNFFSNSCDIQVVRLSKMIGKASLHRRLYVIDVGFMPYTSNSYAIVAHVVSKHTWYNRLGHVSFQKLDKLKTLLRYKDVDIVPCSVCPLAKQRKLSFVSNNYLSQHAFDLIHYDTLGPYSVLG